MRLSVLTLLLVTATLSAAPVTDDIVGPVEGERLARMMFNASNAWATEPPTSRNLFESALVMNPGDDQLTYLAASADAATGDSVRAVVLVKELAKMRSDLTPRPTTFKKVEDAPGFKEARDAWIRVGRRVADSLLAYELNDAQLVPEGIAFDPVDRMFYVGSTLRGEILRFPLSSPVAVKPEVFKASRADGLYSILGLRVDAERRVLWVASSAAPPLTDLTPAETGNTGIFAFDLRTGKLLRHADVPRGRKEHTVNDLVVTKKGVVFATDSSNGAVYRWLPDEASFEEFLPAGTFLGPNGIALSPDESILYVGSWNEGITIVDPETGNHERISHRRGLSLWGPDGLYRSGDSLIAIQNSIGKGRVVRFRLDAAGKTILSAETLSARDPRVEDPTTGAIANGYFYFIANSGIGMAGTPESRAKLDRARILRKKL